MTTNRSGDRPAKARPGSVKARVDRQRADAVGLRAGGLSVTEVAARLGVSYQRVQQLLRLQPANRCRVCGGEIERQKRYHPHCRPSNYRPTGRPVGGEAIDMTGGTYGWWEVLSYTGSGRWACRCRCGVERTVQGTTLRNGSSSSCRSCAAKRRVSSQKRPPS